MKNTIVTIIIIILSFFISCKKKQELNLKKDEPNFIKIVKPLLKLDKIIVINQKEICVTYFKVKIENKNNSSIILLDNSLIENHMKKMKPHKGGFYLKNLNNNSLITLGIDNYYFYEVGAM